MSQVSELASDPHDLPTATQRRAAQALDELLHDRAICPAGQLPPERDLARHVGVSRPTLRQVLRQMERAGVIHAAGSQRRGFRYVVSGSSDLPRLTRESEAAVALIWNASQVFVDFNKRNLAPGWSWQIRLGMLSALQAKAGHVILLDSASLKKKPVGWLSKSGVNGMIVSESAGDDLVAREAVLHAQGKGVRMVIYGDDPWMAPFDRVISDHETGSYEITRLLLRHGRRRPLRLWNVQDWQLPKYWLAMRNQGHERAMQEARLQPLPPLLVPGFGHPVGLDWVAAQRHEARLIAGYLLESFAANPKIDSILAISDGNVAAIVEALKLLGRKPQTDVAVVGYDNYWQDIAQPDNIAPPPPLATIDKLNHNMGEALVDLLMKRIRGELPPEPQRLLLPVKLIDLTKEVRQWQQAEKR